MVLVTAQYRRRGLAHAAAAALHRRSDRTRLVPVLDATPAGREVYRALGFQDSWGFHRLVAAGRATAHMRPSPTASRRSPDRRSDWTALCAYDAAAFGADRSGLLQCCAAGCRRPSFMPSATAALRGFLLGRDGRSAAQLGPLIAEDDATALALLRRALAAISGPIFIDLADAKSAIRSLAGQPRLPRATPADAHAAQPARTVRRRAAHLRGRRARIRLSKRAGCDSRPGLSRMHPSISTASAD